MGDPFLNYFALFLLIFVVVVHHRDPRHRGEDRGVTPSSPPGRDPRRRMGEPVHAARAVAVSLDLGDGAPAINIGLGLLPRNAAGDLKVLAIDAAEADIEISPLWSRRERLAIYLGQCKAK